MMRTSRSCLVITLALSVYGCAARRGDGETSASPTAGHEAAGQVRNRRAPVRVLLIGNSYTYFNNLPEVLEGVAAAAGFDVDAAMRARGGATLRDHLADKQTLDQLRAGDWDYVVIQEQSTLGMRQVEGVATIADPDFFLRHAQRLAQEVRAAGAAPLFLLTWRRRAAPLDDQHRLTSAYASAASRANGVLAPAGLVWERVRQERPDLELFVSDGSHPAPAGTYATAHVLLAAITGRRAEAAISRIVGHPVTPAGKVADTLASLMELSASDARYLRDVAWDEVNRVRLPDWHAPVLHESRSLPMVPAGGPVRLDEVTGNWRGPFAFFRPTGSLTIDMCSGPAGVVGSVEIDFGGRSPLRGPARQVRVDSGMLAFTFGGDSVLRQEVRFSGRMLRDSLAGIAIFDEEGSIGAASWRVGRVADTASGPNCAK